jgi:SAM-dependent methyltransferase
VSDDNSTSRNERLDKEAQRLAQSWMQCDAAMLRDYLVAGVEDPRRNVQSILMRHFLIVGFFGKRFAELLEQELRFSVVVNWTWQALKQIASEQDLHSVRHALEIGSDNADGLPIPRFLAKAVASLPGTFNGVAIPNYLEHILRLPLAKWADREEAEETLATFQAAWKSVLAQAAGSATRLSVVELACGSANDYRFLEAFGLAAFLDYTGLDLCETNIYNAQALFPQARFAVGNAWAIPAPDQSFDCAVVQDLLEHLSLEALEATLAEMCRVTRRSLCLGLFNAGEQEEHLIRPVDLYHWNTLSVPRLRARLNAHGFDVEAVHIDTFLKWRFGCDTAHNKNAYTLFAERRPVPIED